MHMVGIHNSRTGGSTRERILNFTGYACDGISQSQSRFYRWYLRYRFTLRLFFFENFFWLFDKLFGFFRVTTKLEL